MIRDSASGHHVVCGPYSRQMSLGVYFILSFTCRRRRSLVSAAKGHSFHSVIPIVSEWASVYFAQTLKCRQLASFRVRRRAKSQTTKTSASSGNVSCHLFRFFFSKSEIRILPSGTVVQTLHFSDRDEWRGFALF